MIWGCMVASEFGHIKLIDSTVNNKKYGQILQNSLLSTIAKLNICEKTQYDGAAVIKLQKSDLVIRELQCPS